MGGNFCSCYLDHLSNAAGQHEEAFCYATDDDADAAAQDAAEMGTSAGKHLSILIHNAL